MTQTPRMTVIADTWLELGSGVRPLSNAAGLPLARTVKLVLDPLVIRPAQRPHLGHALLDDDAAGELRERIREAGADLASTAAWFTMMKTRRRARKITSGSPQDLLDTRLHLTDGPEAREAAEVIAGLHKPLTAADIMDGGWGIPRRVALLACASGGETGFADPVGLVAALTLRGAELVTSARWTLPTDVGLEWLQAQGLSGSATRSSAPFSAFAEMIVAVDEAHASADPVAALNEWQRSRADAWEHSGDPAYSPLTWGALTTIVS